MPRSPRNRAGVPHGKFHRVGRCMAMSGGRPGKGPRGYSTQHGVHGGRDGGVLLGGLGGARWTSTWKCTQISVESEGTLGRREAAKGKCSLVWCVPAGAHRTSAGVAVRAFPSAFHSSQIVISDCFETEEMRTAINWSFLAVDRAQQKDAYEALSNSHIDLSAYGLCQSAAPDADAPPLDSPYMPEGDPAAVAEAAAAAEEERLRAGRSIFAQESPDPPSAVPGPTPAPAGPPPRRDLPLAVVAKLEQQEAEQRHLLKVQSTARLPLWCRGLARGDPTVHMRLTRRAWALSLSLLWLPMCAPPPPLCVFADGVCVPPPPPVPTRGTCWGSNTS